MYSVWYLNNNSSVVGFSAETIKQIKARADYYHKYYTELYPDTEKSINVTKLCKVCDGIGSRPNKNNKLKKVICKIYNGTGEDPIDEIEYLELLAINDEYGIVTKENI
jgi:hypothetical protein